MVNFIVERIVDRTVTREEITASVLNIGRSAGAHVRSDDPAMSIDHASIEQDAGGFTIVDRESLTGTYMGSKPVQRVRLRRGDRIDAGDLHLEVLEADAGAPLILRVVAAAHPAAAAHRIDYQRALSLQRPWLSKGVLATVVTIATLAAFGALIGTERRRAFMPGTLSSAHERVRALDQCGRCHQPFRQVSNAACQECHRQTRHAEAVVLDPSCAKCHPEHRDQKLTGAEASRRCTECHASFAFGASHPRFSAVATSRFNHAIHSSDCSTCHLLELNGRFAVIRSSCVACHGPAVDSPAMPAKFFTAAEFRHEKHAELPCARCHGNAAAIALPSRETCVECHGARAGVRASPCVTCHRYHRAGGEDAPAHEHAAF